MSSTPGCLPMIVPGVTTARAKRRHAAGQPRPERRPSCFFDRRHGMSVSDTYWAPSAGGAGRYVPVCVACAHKLEQGIEPDIRKVEVNGTPVSYVNAGLAPAYWGGFGLDPGLFTGFCSATDSRPYVRRSQFLLRRRRLRRRGLLIAISRRFHRRDSRVRGPCARRLSRGHSRVGQCSANRQVEWTRLGHDHYSMHGPAGGGRHTRRAGAPGGLACT
jgi:hypothetical protein